MCEGSDSKGRAGPGWGGRWWARPDGRTLLVVGAAQLSATTTTAAAAAAAAMPAAEPGRAAPHQAWLRLRRLRRLRHGTAMAVSLHPSGRAHQAAGAASRCNPLQALQPAAGAPSDHC